MAQAQLNESVMQRDIWILEDELNVAKSLLEILISLGDTFSVNYEPIQLLRIADNTNYDEYRRVEVKIIHIMTKIQKLLRNPKRFIEDRINEVNMNLRIAKERIRMHDTGNSSTFCQYTSNSESDSDEE